MSEDPSASGAETARHWSALRAEGGGSPFRYTLDTALALLYALIFGAPGLVMPPETDTAPWGVAVHVLTTLLVCAGIVLRWRLPRTALATVSVVVPIVLLMGWVPYTLFAVAWILYPVALASDGPAVRPRHAALLGVGALFLVVAGATTAAPLLVPVLFLAVMTLGLSWLLGRSVHDRRVQEKRALAAVAGQARGRERLRVAREVHDVVSHALGAIGMRAGAARYVTAEDPEALRAALVEIEGASRRATDELRGLLTALRADTPVEPLPGLDGIPGLVENARAAGIACALTVRGEDDLPATVDVSVHQVVREALTNVIRHAPGTTCTVALTVGPRAVEVEVTDTGPGPGRPGRPARGSGTGLVGMRERVAAHDGTLTVGPRPEGGFGVLAHLPRTSPPPATEEHARP